MEAQAKRGEAVYKLNPRRAMEWRLRGSSRRAACRAASPRTGTASPSATCWSGSGLDAERQAGHAERSRRRTCSPTSSASNCFPAGKAELARQTELLEADQVRGDAARPLTTEDMKLTWRSSGTSSAPSSAAPRRCVPLPGAARGERGRIQGPALRRPTPALADGRKVTDARTWTSERRPAAAAPFRDARRRRTPACGPRPCFEVVKTDSVGLGGKATRKDVAITFLGEGPAARRMELVGSYPTARAVPVPLSSA